MVLIGRTEVEAVSSAVQHVVTRHHLKRMQAFGADWNAECAEKAQSYIDMMAFSRDGLYDQLAFEGFQQTEIEFGLAAVGY